MDIYSFINYSLDVTAYCREINKTWNPYEMAIIILKSDRFMAEKHAAWRELIQDYPDMPIPDTRYENGYPSLRQKLMAFIEHEERTLALFMKPEQGAVYTFEIWPDELQYSSTFTTFENAWFSAMAFCEHSKISSVDARKIYADSEASIIVFFDAEQNIYEICASRPYILFPEIERISYPFNRKEHYVYIPTPPNRGGNRPKQRGV